MIKILQEPTLTIMQQQNGHYGFIKLEEIIYISKEEGYTMLHLSDKKRIRSRENLSSYYEELKTYNFYYANRRKLFNISYLRELSENKIQLHNGEELKLSRVMRKELLEELKK